jgi:hypothetical protein
MQNAARYAKFLKTKTGEAVAKLARNFVARTVLQQRLLKNACFVGL